MICEECGYELPKNGAPCRVCRNKEKWEEYKKETTQRLFTKRIAKNLLSLDIIPDKEDIETMQTGGGLFFYGTAGCGKSLYAAAVVLEMKRRAYIHPDVQDGQMEFITSLNLLEAIRASFNPVQKEEQEESPKTTREILDHYSSVGLLVLDDLGTEKPTEWALSILQIIINNRYEGMLPTIITSNLGLKALAQQLDDRIASRIYEMCRPVSFGNKDHRLKRS